MSEQTKHTGYFDPDYFKPRHQVDANGKPRLDADATQYEIRAFRQGLFEASYAYECLMGTSGNGHSH